MHTSIINRLIVSGFVVFIAGVFGTLIVYLNNGTFSDVAFALVIVILLNIAFLLVSFFYVLRSSIDESFNLFNPFFFPLVFFAILYVLPSLIHVYFWRNTCSDFGNYLHLIALSSFLLGVVLNRQFALSNLIKLNKYFYRLGKLDKNTVYFIYFLGFTLLMTYGIQTGVTTTLLSGGNIEGLRRYVEIGRGIQKETGILFISFSMVWIVAEEVNHSKHKKITLHSIVLIVVTSLIIFITTGHKAPVLTPLLLIVGMRAKDRYISPMKVGLFGLMLLILIGGLTYIRGTRAGDLTSSILNKGIYYQSLLYESNYLPIVKIIQEGRMDLQHGKEYIQNAAFIIPRFLWPDKPLNFDLYLKEQLHRSFEGGGLPATPIGSLYLNFGLIGVVFGMLGIGVCYAILFDIYLSAPNIESSMLALYGLWILLNPSLILPRVELIILLMGVLFLADKILRRESYTIIPRT